MLVLILEIREPILEVFKAGKRLIVSRFVIDHCLEEISEDFLPLEVVIFVRKTSLPLGKLLLKALDLLLLADDSQLLLRELLLLILALQGVLLEDRCFRSDIENHLLLFFLVLLPLSIKLTSSGYDLLLLCPEILLCLPLLTLFLKKAHGLQRSLACKIKLWLLQNARSVALYSNVIVPAACAVTG